jgi:hypothetical protein
MHVPYAYLDGGEEPATTPLPDYTRLYSTGILSDCSVIIKEEGQTTSSSEQHHKAKRARQSAAQASTEQNAGTLFKTIPVHKVVLWGTSKFFQAKVCSFSSPLRA